MKFLKIVLIALFAVVLFSCNQKPKQVDSQQEAVQENVAYYRHIQFTETSWDLEKGTHALTAKEAKTVNNYKFTYNESKQLVSVEYNRNGVLLGYSSLGAAKITYTYEGDKQLKSFFNDKGEASKNGGASTYEYTLNDAGMRVAMRFVDDKGESIENRNNVYNYVWKKLPDGMIQELRYNLAGEEVVMNPFCPFYELRFSYDEKGYLVRMANYEEDKLYDCTEENCGDIGVSYFLFENSKDGDVKHFSVHNTGGQLSNLYSGWAKRINVIDENGYVLETTQFDQDDEMLGGKRLPVTTSVFDEHGAMVKRISMNKDKNITNNPDSGVAIVEYKYDEEGRRLETVEYDKDGVLVEKKG
ncbi:MAG: hypothetical protein HQ522_05225 [Bacteroidetes bacterium]|nr:hypothetical protein [Bacteroidota bacterium]